MHLIYLQSEDIHINLDRITAVKHDAENESGKVVTMLLLSAITLGDLVEISIYDSEDRALLREHLDYYTIKVYPKSAEVTD